LSDLLIDACHACGVPNISPGNVFDSGVLFIVDEAQSSYSDLKLWALIKGLLNQGGTDIHFCLFSAYGSPEQGVPKFRLPITPVIIPSPQRISLTQASRNSCGRIGVFLD
jgi:hypothetical protein